MSYLKIIGSDGFSASPKAGAKAPVSSFRRY